MSRLAIKFKRLLPLLAVLTLTGCGVSTKTAGPAAAAGVERCGSETRACWQVKSTVDVSEYPPEPAATPDGRRDTSEQTSATH